MTPHIMFSVVVMGKVGLGFAIRLPHANVVDFPFYWLCPCAEETLSCYMKWVKSLASEMSNVNGNTIAAFHVPSMNGSHYRLQYSHDQPFVFNIWYQCKKVKDNMFQPRLLYWFDIAIPNSVVNTFGRAHIFSYGINQTCTFDNHKKIRGVRFSIQFLMVPPHRFANATHVLLCKSNQQSWRTWKTNQITSTHLR